MQLLSWICMMIARPTEIMWRKLPHASFAPKLLFITLNTLKTCYSCLSDDNLSWWPSDRYLPALPRLHLRGHETQKSHRTMVK